MSRDRKKYKYAMIHVPILTNGFSRHYHLCESTFILGESGVILNSYSIFSKISLCSRITTEGTPRSVESHLGYIVCPCPIKRTPGLNELMKQTPKQEDQWSCKRSPENRDMQPKLTLP